MTGDLALQDPMVGPGRVRRFNARWSIRFQLVALSPLHLGAGEPRETVDLGLLRDPVSRAPLLTGASLAGALREHLCRHLLGDRHPEQGPGSANSPIVALFGGVREDPEGPQSDLIVYDALGGADAAEIRDGVRLEPDTGTAFEHAKFDLELWPAGTAFEARVDLQIPQATAVDEEARRLAHLILALEGLGSGALRLGARGRRGYGRCRGEAWSVERFDLATRAGWVNWLREGIRSTPGSDNADLVAAVGEAWPEGASRVDAELQKLRAAAAAQDLRIEVPIRFRGGVLIGAPQESAGGADTRHLRSSSDPVISGTGLCGALRQRARRIADVVRYQPGDGRQWVEELFGSEPPEAGTAGRGPALVASRLRVEESTIENGGPLEITRIQIDRFTQAPCHGALLQEEPWLGGASRLELTLELPSEPPLADALCGFLLLLVKDLLLGEVPIGGTTGIGRGGVLPDGTVTLRHSDLGDQLEIDPDVAPPEAAAERLEAWVGAFHDHPRLARDEEAAS